MCLTAVLRLFIFYIVSVLFLDCCYGATDGLTRESLGVPDTLAVVGKVFSYKIPDNAFRAHNIVKYKVREAGSKELPLWLDYDEVGRTLFGVPTVTDEGLIYIKVTAITSDHHTLSDVFSIDVQLGGPLPQEGVMLHCGSHQPKTIGTLMLDVDMGQITGLERVKVIDDFSSFLSLQKNEVMLSLPIAEGVQKLLGISVLAAGPGNTNLTDQGVGLRLSWPVGCGHFTKIKELSQVLEHNCRSGRMSNVTGFGVVGWYICLETPLDYMAVGRQKRQVASVAQLLGTPLATPSITPSPPTLLTNIKSTTLLINIPVVESSPLFESSLQLPPSTLLTNNSIQTSTLLQPSTDSSSAFLLLPTTKFTETPPLTLLLPSSMASLVSSPGLTSSNTLSTLIPVTVSTPLLTNINRSQAEFFSFTLSPSEPMEPLMSLSFTTVPLFSSIEIINGSSLSLEFNDSVSTDFAIEQSSLATSTIKIIPSTSTFIDSSSLSYFPSVEQSLVPPVNITSTILENILSTELLPFSSLSINVIVSTVLPSITEGSTQPFFLSSSTISSESLGLSGVFPSFVTTTLSSESLSSRIEILGSSLRTDIELSKTSSFFEFFPSSVSTILANISLTKTQILESILHTDIELSGTISLLEPFPSSLSTKIAKISSTKTETLGSIILTDIALSETSALLESINSTGVMLTTSSQSIVLLPNSAEIMPTSFFSIISSSPTTPSMQSLLLTQEVTPTETILTVAVPLSISSTEAFLSSSVLLGLSSSLLPPSEISDILTAGITLSGVSPSENIGLPSLSSLFFVSSIPASVMVSSPSLTTAPLSSSIFPTTPKPTTPTPEPPNLAPVIVNPLDYLAVTVGNLFSFTIPEDTFYDYEDGSTSTLKLSLVTLDLQPVSLASWIQLNSSSQTLYGIPLDIDLSGLPYYYALVATDSEGKQNWEVFAIELFAEDSSLLTHVIKLQFDLDFANFVSDRGQVVDLVDRIAGYYGDHDSSYLSIFTVSDGSTILSFYNNTLIGEDCNKTSIEQLYSQLVNSDGTFNIEFLQIVFPAFPPKAASLEYLGACKTEVPTTVSSSTEQPIIIVAPQPVTDDHWLTSVIPATCVAVILLILGLGSFLLYRRKHSSHKHVSPEEKQIYLNNRKPIIMDDEMDIKQPRNFVRPTRPSVLLNDISPFSRTPPHRPFEGPSPPAYRLPPLAMVPPSSPGKPPEQGPAEETASLPPYTLQPIYTRPPPAYSLPPPYIISSQSNSNI